VRSSARRAPPRFQVLLKMQSSADGTVSQTSRASSAFESMGGANPLRGWAALASTLDHSRRRSASNIGTEGQDVAHTHCLDIDEPRPRRDERDGGQAFDRTKALGQPPARFPSNVRAEPERGHSGHPWSRPIHARTYAPLHPRVGSLLGTTCPLSETPLRLAAGPVKAGINPAGEKPIRLQFGGFRGSRHSGWANSIRGKPRRTSRA